MYRLYLCYADGEEFMDDTEYTTKEEAKDTGDFLYNDFKGTDLELVCYYVYEF